MKTKWLSPCSRIAATSQPCRHWTMDWYWCKWPVRIGRSRREEPRDGKGINACDKASKRYCRALESISSSSFSWRSRTCGWLSHLSDSRYRQEVPQFYCCCAGTVIRFWGFTCSQTTTWGRNLEPSYGMFFPLTTPAATKPHGRNTQIYKEIARCGATFILSGIESR